MSEPNDGLVIGIPKPRNERDASLIIALATCLLWVQPTEPCACPGTLVGLRSGLLLTQTLEQGHAAGFTAKDLLGLDVDQGLG